MGHDMKDAAEKAGRERKVLRLRREALEHGGGGGQSTDSLAMVRATAKQRDRRWHEAAAKQVFKHD